MILKRENSSWANLESQNTASLKTISFDSIADVLLSEFMCLEIGGTSADATLAVNAITI